MSKRWLAAGDAYNGNLYEVFAKRAASEMNSAAGSQMCPNWWRWWRHI